MTGTQYVQWLEAVNDALAGLVTDGTKTAEDENFLSLWWRDIRESWAWAPACRCGFQAAKGRFLCQRCIDRMLEDRRRLEGIA